MAQDWRVKVAFVIRRGGATTQSLRTALLASQPALDANVRAALGILEPAASLIWQMQVNPRTDIGPNAFEIYPRLIVGMPNASNRSAVFTRAIACRDSLLNSLDTLATANSWTVLERHSDRMPGEL